MSRGVLHYAPIVRDAGSCIAGRLVRGIELRARRRRDLDHQRNVTRVAPRDTSSTERLQHRYVGDQIAARDTDTALGEDQEPRARGCGKDCSAKRQLQTAMLVRARGVTMSLPSMISNRLPLSGNVSRSASVHGAADGALAGSVMVLTIPPAIDLRTIKEVDSALRLPTTDIYPMRGFSKLYGACRNRKAQKSEPNVIILGYMRRKSRAGMRGP